MGSNGSASGTVVLAALLGVVIGGVGGFYVRFWNAPEPGGARVIGGETATPMAGGGGMAIGPASAGAELARMVRTLAAIEKVQNRGLTAAQAKEILPILRKIRDAEAIPEAEASARLADISALLTDEQRQALAALQPARGSDRSSRTSASGANAAAPTQPQAGMLMPPPGGAPTGSMAGGGGGMMGGGGPERTFASERNTKALADLIAAAESLVR